jgi:peroxiredoxin
MAEKHSSKRKWLIIIGGIWIGVCIGAVVIAALVGVGFLSLDPKELAVLRTPLAGIDLDKPAPDFELENISGQKVHLADLRGKPVVINYWATWCGPCVREMPMFEDYHKKYPDFVMLGIDVEESAEKVRKFIADLGLEYEILLDQETKAADLYKVMILPSTYFVDQNGILRYQHLGYMSEEQFKYYMEQLGVAK